MTEAAIGAAATISPSPRLRVQAMKEYHPPLGNRDLLRLDFNENTLACSSRVRARATGGPPSRCTSKQLGSSRLQSSSTSRM